MKRALYISPMTVHSDNGMLHRQRQNVSTLAEIYPDGLDVLSLGAPVAGMQRWLRAIGVKARVLDGPYAWVARWNATAWYGGGVILCNKLRLFDRFRFPVRTPLPVSLGHDYDRIICYYAWAYHLLELGRVQDKVIVDLGDVMADRHERTGARRWITLDSRDESAILASRSRCYAISSDDANEFRSLYGKNLPVLPFAPVQHGTFTGISNTARPRRVGFIGAPSYLNEQILRLLAQPGFMDVLREADITLVVAGSICSTVDPSLLERLRRGGAEIQGRVVDIADFYRGVGIVINPVGPSTGVKIKSVEALMSGRTLITTRWGADVGLEQAFGDQVVVVEWPIEPTALASRVVAAFGPGLLHGPERALAYAQLTRDAMHAAYS